MRTCFSKHHLRSGYEITPVVYFMDRNGVGVHTNNNNKLKANRWTRCDHLAHTAANQNTGIVTSCPLAQLVITLNVNFVFWRSYVSYSCRLRFLAFGSLRWHHGKRKESVSSEKVLIQSFLNCGKTEKTTSNPKSQNQLPSQCLTLEPLARDHCLYATTKF